MPSPAGSAGTSTGVPQRQPRLGVGRLSAVRHELEPHGWEARTTAESELIERAAAWDGVRSTFAPGDALTFDERYRYAQLPLIAADHPLVLATSPDGEYRDGRYTEPRISVVVPVPVERLFVDPIFLSYEADLASAPFASKLARGIELRRAHRLHATLASVDSSEGLLEQMRNTVGGFEPFRARLSGPVIGGFNRGRCYLPACSEAFAPLQAAVGGRPAPLIGVGLHHFRDELDASETAALAAFLERWQHVTLFEWTVTELAVTATNDDLVLSGRTLARIPLRRA